MERQRSMWKVQGANTDQEYIRFVLSVRKCLGWENTNIHIFHTVQFLFALFVVEIR